MFDLEKSLVKWYKMPIIPMLVLFGLAVIFLGIGQETVAVVSYNVACVMMVIIAIQMIREDKIAHGVLVCLFGALTFGIWPAIVANKRSKFIAQKIENNEHIILDGPIRDRSLCESYKYGKYIAIFGLITSIIIIGIYIQLFACFIIGIQLIRQGRITYGLLLIIFGSFTLGIWPFVQGHIEQKRMMAKMANA